MKQTILIHGAPYEEEFYNKETASPSNTNWFPWLQKQLALRNELCQALEYPKPFDPEYQDWLEVFGQHKLDKETILVGHSCGAGFLIRFLSENPDVLVKKVILVAPWLDPTKELTTSFFDFTIQSEFAETNDVQVFVSSDDDQCVLDSVEQVRREISEVTFHEFVDRGHFCGPDQPEFPELLALL